MWRILQATIEPWPSLSTKPLGSPAGCRRTVRTTLRTLLCNLRGADEAPPVQLSLEEKEAITTSRAAAARGEFATDYEFRSVWAKHGR
jgi:hypothetical protein